MPQLSVRRSWLVGTVGLRVYGGGVTWEYCTMYLLQLYNIATTSAVYLLYIFIYANVKLLIIKATHRRSSCLASIRFHPVSSCVWFYWQVKPLSLARGALRLACDGCTLAAQVKNELLSHHKPDSIHIHKETTQPININIHRTPEHVITATPKDHAIS